MHFDIYKWFIYFIIIFCLYIQPLFISDFISVTTHFLKFKFFLCFMIVLANFKYTQLKIGSSRIRLRIVIFFIVI